MSKTGWEEERLGGGYLCWKDQNVPISFRQLFLKKAKLMRLNPQALQRCLDKELEGKQNVTGASSFCT